MAFSYLEHHPSLTDFAYLLSTPTEMSLFHSYSSEDTPQLPVAHARLTFGISNNSLDIASLRPPPVADHPVCHAPVVSDPSDEKAPKQQGSGEKKRKINKDETSLITGQSKEGKSSKQKRPNYGLSEKLRGDDTKTSKPCGELPAGYIHVRARRGEATDSHSLAERVRREKISERMKVLQSLVPGCEKVTGKALMLDEIINYVQSLQNQIEFLSMKLASLNPLLYFGADLDDDLNQPERAMRGIPLQVPSIGQTSHLHPIAFENGTADYQMMGHKADFFLQAQGTTSFPQGGSSYMVQQVGQRQELFSETEDINTCSFP